jgi:hypothetical protein
MRVTQAIKITFIGLSLATAVSYAKDPVVKESNLSGRYYLAMLPNQPEAVSAFQLNPDHRFEWFLTYGSLDAYAKGTWQLNSNHELVLTSDPVEHKPYFKQIDSRNEREKCDKTDCKYPSSYPITIQLLSKDKDINWQDAKVGLSLGNDAQWIKKVDANGTVKFDSDAEHTDKNGVYGISIEMPSKDIIKPQNFPKESGARQITYEFQVADPRRFPMNKSTLTATALKGSRATGWSVVSGDIPKNWVFIKVNGKK